jgi:translation initiation factor IF-3
LTTFRRPQTKENIRPNTNVSTDTHRINNKITSREVRLISDNGEQLGVMTTLAAISIAEEKELDLVEVAPQAKPPVCRLMDYGKFKYREQKKEAEARKKRADNLTKELRIRYRTDTGDLETKLRRARDFILHGDKVKFSMRFKGREVAYCDLGAEKFEEIIKELSDISIVEEKSPKGRMMSITLAPTAVKTIQPSSNTEKEPISTKVVQKKNQTTVVKNLGE